MTHASNNNTDLDFRESWQGGAHINDDAPPALAINADINFDALLTINSANIEFGNSPPLVEVAIYPTGFDSNNFSTPSIYNSAAFIVPRGIYPYEVGLPSTQNKARVIKAIGVSPPLFDRPSVYNLKQHLKPQGKDLSVYGKPALQGGVRWLNVYGFNASVIGKHDLFNPKANQELKPSGINSQAMGALNVSPRILYPIGIDPRTLREPQVPQPAVKSPQLAPNGFVSSNLGQQTIWYHTRPLAPKGIDSFDTGFPRVFDPTQFIQQIPFEQSTIFGDIALRNKSAFLKPLGIPENGVSPWSLIESKNRYYQIKGVDSQRIGDAAIHNNTPSLFADGIDASIKAGKPAIGYWVREVKPTGFDHLALGRPLLTKTPELLPRGLDALSFGGATVWFKNRTLILDGRGIKSEVAGNPTVWFRYRYATLQGWQSSRFANPTLTHGVREIIARGFLSERQNNYAWVSHGTRQLAPKSIYTEFPSNHFVGRHQEIKPQGYEATLWGERIIPEIQAAYPQGFAGVFGLAMIDNFTRYILPASFISVGNQPADRWGWQTVFNQTQYVSIEVTEDSGLVPPRWSEWQSIENRNKTVGAVGTLSQKFGYTQIDNNASPLLPIGIEPIPPSRTTMISHAVRTIKLEGIEPPPVNSWGVVHNAARVLGAKGFDAQALGADSDVVNTRRHYRNVGRIESQEFGTPMIADRIRTISIEPRHSIYPPYIQLPVVDLWTRYVSFNGYETAKYGLPAISEHFNIIAPKWSHSNRFGYPTLKNLTPELGVYGHDSSDFGQTGIRTQWRNITTMGDTATLFGESKIADSKQAIEVRGWRDGAIGSKLEVIRMGAPPYSQQSISLDGYMDYGKGEKGEYISGYGISSDQTFYPNRIPKPGLNQNVLYAKSIEPPKMESPVVRTNTIEVVPGIAIHNIGNNHSVINKQRYITLTEDHQIPSTIKFGKPRMSPHTIYAVVEAPSQAQQNHQEEGRLHFVNSNGGNRPAGEVFGFAKVESTIRSIKPIGFDMLRMDRSDHRIINKNSMVSPTGFRRTRFGIPAIPFTPQSIIMFSKDGDLSSTFGLAKLQSIIRGDQTIKVLGADQFISGKNKIENHKQIITANGFDAAKLGTRKDRDTPFMWQGLRVGAHIPLVIGGDDMACFGDTMIGLRIRGIEVIGFDAFISEYDGAGFDKRMTIKHAKKPAPEPQRLTTTAIEPASTIGNQDLKYGQHFIRPDGNSDQFRKGGFA